MNARHAALALALAASLSMIAPAVSQPYGPGMMRGDGGGWGPGMMGGYGGGMGPGMMWGYGGDAYAGLDLSADQRKKIAEIREQTRKSMWQLMGTMQEQGYHMHDLVRPGPFDEQAARKAYDSMAATQKSMFDLQLDAHRKIDAVLTPEQRDKLRKAWSNR